MYNTSRYGNCDKVRALPPRAARLFGGNSDERAASRCGLRVGRGGTMTLSRILLVLGIVLAASSADCLALSASSGCLALAHPTRCGRPCMAAKKRAKQVTRREALSGGGFDSDEVYKDLANAGIREPLLFGGIAVVAAFGLSQRGQFVDTLTALDAAQPHKTTGDRVPSTQLAAAKAKFKVEVSGDLL